MMSRQRGFSLVELIIAVAIAMIVLLVVSQVYVGGITTQRAQTDVMRLNESSRFAFDVMSRELRLAGFSNVWQPGSTASDLCASGNQPAIFAVNDPVSVNPAAPSATMTTLAPLTNIYSPAANRYNDVLRVRYYGENSTGTPSVLDCHGYAVGAGVLVQDTLFVAPDANNNNEPTLFCYTDNPAPVTATHPGVIALVAGVESLQLLYGQDTDQAPDGIVNRYVPANLIASTVGGTTRALNEDDILGVKVSILVRSPNSVSNDRPLVGCGPMGHFTPNVSVPGACPNAPANPYPAAANADNSAIFPSAGVDVPADGRARLMLSSEVAIRKQRCE